MQYLHQFSFCILFIMVIYCFKYGFLQFSTSFTEEFINFAIIYRMLITSAYD